MPNYLPGQDLYASYEQAPQSVSLEDAIETAEILPAYTTQTVDLFSVPPVIDIEDEDFEESAYDEDEQVDLIPTPFFDAEVDDDVWQQQETPVDTQNEYADHGIAVHFQVSPQTTPTVERPQTSTLLDTFRSHREQVRMQKQESAQRAALEAAEAHQAHERTLRLRATEAGIRYNQYAISYSEICQNPVLQTPSTIHNASPLFTTQDLQYLRMPRYVNDQIAAEMQRRITYMASGGITIVDLTQQSLSLSHEQMRASDTVRTLISTVRSQLDETRKAKRKGSIDESIDADEHATFDANVSARTQQTLEDILLQASAKYIINPYPENEPHKVYAFDELTKALGIKPIESSIDGNFLQPVVKTRMIYRDGNVQVDPEVDGIGKLYASFGSQSTYEMIGQQVDPQNITGLVKKKPTDAYAGNFMVHMRERSLGPDTDYNYAATDGSVAYVVQYDVNAMHVDPELYSQTQSNINEQLAQEGQWAHRAGDPLTHARASVLVHSQLTLPAQRDIVASTMEAAVQANIVYHDTRHQNIQRRDEERLRALPKLPGIGSTVLGNTLEIENR